MELTGPKDAQNAPKLLKYLKDSCIYMTVAFV